MGKNPRGLCARADVRGVADPGGDAVRLGLPVFSVVGQGLKIFLLASLLAVFLAGCASEHTNPLAVEHMGGSPPKQEAAATMLDARGLINGTFRPANAPQGEGRGYPIRYEGQWDLVPSGPKTGWYMAMSDQVGARIDVVATASRVVFDFWDYDFYENPGRVQFLLDGRPIGAFALSRQRGLQKILEYQVVTGKTTVATVSMVVETGRAVISGYMLVFP
jgi:hypothetical protein